MSLPEYPPRIATNEDAALQFLKRQRNIDRSCFSNGLDAQEEDKRINFNKVKVK